MARRIAEFSGVGPDDWAFEIGPGRGALTRHLAPRTSELYGVEKDEALAAGLVARGLFSKDRLTTGDFLEHPLSAFSLPSRPGIVVGNLPYNVSVPIIFHVMEDKARVKRAVFMVQREVGLRLAAEPGSKAYGIPSVLLQAEARVERGFLVKRTHFNPPPKVESIVIALTPQATPFKDETEKKAFATLVKQAFSARRKVIANTIPAYRPLFATAGLSGRERPEEISLAGYLALMRAPSHS